MPMTTEEFAARAGVKPNTIRFRLCRTGSYFGIIPEKRPNRMLAWPDDADIQLLKNRGQLVVIERSAQEACAARRRARSELAASQ